VGLIEGGDDDREFRVRGQRSPLVLFLTTLSDIGRPRG
jgi:hypothetical protein